MKRSLCLVREKLFKVVALKMSSTESRLKVVLASLRNKRKEPRTV